MSNFQVKFKERFRIFNKIKKFEKNTMKISKKYWIIWEVAGNFEDNIESNFRDFRQKWNIRETWKYLIENVLRVWKICEDF